MPLATAVLSGERADDGLDMPLIQRIEAGIRTTGRLLVGDGTLSALATRADVAGPQHVSLSPLPLTGATAEAMGAWSSEGIAQDREGELERMVRFNPRAEAVWAAEGDAFARRGCLEEGPAAWAERGLVVRSPGHAERQAQGLDNRLATAEQKLAALTPARGRGKRQISDEATRIAAIAPGRKDQRVDGWLTVAWARQVEQTTHDVGRGRGSATRAQRMREPIRAHITGIPRQDGAIQARRQRFGWKALATNAPQERLSVADAVWCYRNAYRIERIVNRLKSRGPSAPLSVKRDDQIEGRTYLLTLGIRVLTVREFVLRRSLQHDQVKRPGLPPENRRKHTDTPTAERLLKAFSDVSLTSLKTATGEDIRQRLTPLSALQQDILQRLGLGVSLYQQLEIQNMRG